MGVVNTLLMVGAFVWGGGKTINNSSPQVDQQAPTHTLEVNEGEDRKDFNDWLEKKDIKTVTFSSEDGYSLRTMRNGKAICTSEYSEDGTTHIIHDGPETWAFSYDSDGNLESRKYENGKTTYFQYIGGHGRLLLSNGDSLSEKQAEDFVADMFLTPSFPEIGEKAEQDWNEVRAKEKQGDALAEAAAWMAELDM